MSIELGAVRRFVRRNVRYLIELRAVRSLLGEMRGMSMMELRVVRRLCRRNERYSV